MEENIEPGKLIQNFLNEEKDKNDENFDNINEDNENMNKKEQKIDDRIKEIQTHFIYPKKFEVKEVDKLVTVKECINVNQNKGALNTLYLCSCQNNREFLVCEACKDNCHDHGHKKRCEWK